MGENGAFKDEIQKKLGLTDEENDDFKKIIDEMITKDDAERANRVAKKAIKEFKERQERKSKRMAQ